ncbi:MAG: hypothetical protein HYU68_05880 [Bacteroidetes bacterium]|nr:hypothetical protein [Bacteroidota bacterium]
MKTLAILAGVMGILFILMLVFPSDGITIGAFKMEFPSANEFFNIKAHEELNQLKDLNELFDSTVVLSEIDSTIIKHKLDSLHQYRKTIQITDKAKPALHRFFDALDNAKNQKVRIMHYGDSQIEADRITSYFRNELQTKFGGYGTGLFSVIDVAPKMSVNILYSENWKRYSGFGQKEPEITHNKYGALISFCRYAPVPTSPIITDTTTHTAWIKLLKPRASYGRTKSYQQVNVFVTNSHTAIHYKIEADGVVVNEGTIGANTPFQVLKANFNTTPEEITISFDGKDSPNVLALSLEGNTGIVADNIALRGSSGTVFTQLDQTLLSNMFTHLNPSLIILEFGGNVMPYIKDENAAIEYGNWFKSHINLLKRHNPNAAFIVIGPGDMSIKDKTEYITYPNLEFVRDALKDAALSTGCMFWDMYEVMGGKNSMPQWVNAEPSLAASDYIHFSPLGAKKIAEEFYNNLMNMYNKYKGKDSPTPPKEGLLNGENLNSQTQNNTSEN